MRLKDKIALITGGARGIGLGFATEFVKQGAKVVIADINLEAAVAAAASIGPGATAKKLDVTKVDDIEKVVAEVDAEFGGIDILVNNAAIFDLDAIEDITEASYEKVMNVNLKGPLFVMREVSRVMIKRGRGGRSSTWPARPAAAARRW